MKTSAKIVFALLVIASSLFAQQPVVTPSVTFPLSVGTPFPPTPGGPPSIIGTGGSGTYYYWLVSEFSVGNSPLSGPYVAYDAPNTLSSGNYVFLSWNPVPGATSYDLLRTLTPNAPGGACNCAVVSGTSSTTANDQSNSLNSYTVNTFQPQNFQLSLQNEAVGSGATHMILRRQPGGAQIADLSVTGSGSGNVNGPGSSTVNDLAAFNNGIGSLLEDTGILFSNLTTQASNGAANTVCTYTGANKVCVPGPVTSAMLALGANPGVFTNTQMNEYTQSLIGGCNPLTEFQGGHSGDYATDALTGCLTVPSTSTVTQANAVAGYVDNSSTASNAVAGSFSARCAATGTNCWGINPIVYSIAGHPSNLLNEIDVNFNNTADTGYGLITLGYWTAQPAVAPNANVVAQPSGVSGAHWSSAFYSAVASSTYAFAAGPTSAANSSPSQPYAFQYIDSGGVTHLSTIDVDASGNMHGSVPLVVPGLTDTAMTGGPFCIHENAGVLSATSADCGSGSGGFTAGGDLSGSSSSQEVVGILSHAVPTLASGYLNWNGSAFAWNTPSGTLPTASAAFQFPVSTAPGTTYTVGVLPEFYISNCTVAICGTVPVPTADFAAAINTAMTNLGTGYLINAKNPGGFASTGPTYCLGGGSFQWCVFSDSDISAGLGSGFQENILWGSYWIISSALWTTPVAPRWWVGVPSGAAKGPIGTAWIACYAPQTPALTCGPSAYSQISTTVTRAVGGPFLDASPYATGTISVAAGNNPTVTGSGTTWTSAMVGGYLTSCATSGSLTQTCPQVTNACSALITAVNSSTSLTIAGNWGTENSNCSTATAGLVYEIYHPTAIPLISWAGETTNDAYQISSFGSLLQDFMVDMEGLPLGIGVLFNGTQERDRYNGLHVALNSGNWNNGGSAGCLPGAVGCTGEVATASIMACGVWDRTFNFTGESGPAHYQFTAGDCTTGPSYIASAANTEGYPWVLEAYDLLRGNFGDSGNMPFDQGTVTGKNISTFQAFHDCGWYDGFLRLEVLNPHCEFTNNGLEFGQLNGGNGVVVQNVSTANMAGAANPAAVHFYVNQLGSHVENVNVIANSQTILQDDSAVGQTITSAGSNCPNPQCTVGFYLQPTAFNGTTGLWHVGSIEFDGTTSGSASIGVPAAAGSTSQWLMPINDPTVNQILQAAAPSGGHVQLSWVPGGGSMVYPGAGLPVSTGGAWGTSLANATSLPELVTYVSGAAALAPGGVNVDPQTGDYTFGCPTDRLGEIEFNIPAAHGFYLPQAGSSACTQSSMAMVVRNAASSTAILTLCSGTGTSGSCTAGSSTFQPEATNSINLIPGAAAFVYSDATTSTGNYHDIPIASPFGGVNTQTANYTATLLDKDKLIVMNCASACALTLPAAPPSSKWNIGAMSIGSTLATVSLNSLNFNGGASAPALIKYMPIMVRTDGSNYFGDAPLVAGSNVTLTPTANGVTLAASGSAGITVTPIQFPIAVCQGTGVSVGGSGASATLPATLCIAGSSTVPQSGAQLYAQATLGTLYVDYSIILPSTWTAVNSVVFKVQNDTATSGTDYMNFQYACVADASSDTPTYAVVQQASGTVPGTINTNVTLTLATPTITGCSAKNTMYIRIGAGTGSGAFASGNLRLTQAEMEIH